MTPLQLLYFFTLFVACVYAFLFGGKPEREGATIVVLASFMSTAVFFASDSRFHSVEIGILIVDIATLIAFFRISLICNRFWPLWATAFHSITVLTHLAVYFDPLIVPQAYATGQGIWAYPVLAALLLGSVRHRRRRSPQVGSALRR